MEEYEIGMTFVLGILGIGATFGGMFLKFIYDLKKEIAKLCERIAHLETKSEIYHPSGLIKNGYENIVHSEDCTCIRCEQK